MSEDVSVKLTRAGTQVSGTGIFTVQLDKIEGAESAFYQGGDPYFPYEAYTMGLPTSNPLLVLQDDHLVDQVTNDPIIGVKRTWRIISDPEAFSQDQHWEWKCVLYRGT